MALTIDTIQITHFAVGEDTVVFAITPDGQKQTAHGATPAEARAKIEAWLAALPEVAAS